MPTEKLTFTYVDMCLPDYITNPKGLISVSTPDISEYENGTCLMEDPDLVESLAESIKDEINRDESIPETIYDQFSSGDYSEELRELASSMIGVIADHMRLTDPSDWDYSEVRFYFRIS